LGASVTGRWAGEPKAAISGNLPGSVAGQYGLLPEVLLPRADDELKRKTKHSFQRYDRATQGPASPCSVALRWLLMSRKPPRQNGTKLGCSAPLASTRSTIHASTSVSSHCNPTTIDLHWPWKLTFGQIPIDSTCAQANTQTHLAKANQTLLCRILLRGRNRHDARRHPRAVLRPVVHHLRRLSSMSPR
jgi:hypothetical protein